MTTISFRRMREEDKPAIIEITQLMPWPRHYLPACLDAWIKDPERLLISFLIGDKVVGFVCYSYLDNGKTRFPEGARIHPEYIGTGIYKEFLKQKKSLFQHNGFPYERVRVRWATTGFDGNSYAITFMKYLHTVWTQFGISHRKLPVFNNLGNIVKSIENHVKPMAKVDYKQLHEHISEFFPPRDLILLASTVWDPTLSNLKLLAEGRYEPHHTSVEYWIGGWQVEGGTNGRGKSYSISCITPVDGGFFYYVTIHTKDLRLFFHHLHHHVQIFQQKGSNGQNGPKFWLCAFDVELQSQFLQLVSEIPDSNMKNEYFLSQLGIFQDDLAQSKM